VQAGSLRAPISELPTKLVPIRGSPKTEAPEEFLLPALVSLGADGLERYFISNWNWIGLLFFTLI